MEHSAHHKETIVKRITPFPLSSPHSGAHRSAHLDLNYASCPRTLMQPFYPPAGDSRGSWGRNILCLLFWKLPISRPVPCYTFWCLAICQRSLNFTLGERADPTAPIPPVECHELHPWVHTESRPTEMYFMEIGGKTLNIGKKNFQADVCFPLNFRDLDGYKGAWRGF